MVVRLRKSSAAGGFLVGIVATALAVAIRWLVDPWLGDMAPLITLYGAIAAAIGYGGLPAGIAAAVFGYLACNFLFIEPSGAFAIRNAHDAERLALYLINCSIIIVVGEALRVARRRAEANWQYALAKQTQLEAEVAQRTRAENALREADLQKDAFLATAAHELRNPLAAAQYALQLLRQAEGDHKLTEEAHTILERQVANLTRLVDDLLDVARISKGKVDLQKRPIELAAVCNDAVEASHPLIEQMGHELVVTLPPQPVYLDVDPLRVTQVLSNLLNNAAKYTERGGRIWLTAERQGSDAVVTVKDTGVGIPEDMLPHVFDIFTQVNGPMKRSQGGLGLGLALARRLTEMHGGSIEVRSGPPGRGSEFTVRLPVASYLASKESPPSEAPIAAHQNVASASAAISEPIRSADD